MSTITELSVELQRKQDAELRQSLLERSAQELDAIEWEDEQVRLGEERAERAETR